MKQLNIRTITEKLSHRIITLCIALAIGMGIFSFVSNSAYAAIACGRCSNNNGCQYLEFYTNDASCTQSSVSNGTAYPGGDPLYKRTNQPPSVCPRISTSVAGWNNSICDTYYTRPPKGNFDGIEPQGNYMSGWACDLDTPGYPIWVHFYVNADAFNGGTYIGAVLANQAGESAIASQCGGSTSHRFLFTIPNSAPGIPNLKDGVARNIYAHAIDDYSPNGGYSNAVLWNSPKQLQMINCGNICSSNYGCADTGGAYIGKSSCSDPLYPPLPYRQNLSCPRVAVPPGNNTTFCPAPAAPTGLTATCTNNAGTYNLSFDWADTPTAVKYSFRVSDNSDASAWAGVCPGNANDSCLDVTPSSFSRTGISGHSYSWWVHAVNSDNQTSASSATATVVCNPPTGSITLSATSCTIPYGSPECNPNPTISWTSSNASSVTLKNENTGQVIGSGATGGPITVPITTSGVKTFKLYSDTTVIATATVNATQGALQPPPNGAFRQTGGLIFPGTGNVDYGLPDRLGDLSLYNWKVADTYSGTKEMLLSYAALKAAATSANQVTTAITNPTFTGTLTGKANSRVYVTAANTDLTITGLTVNSDVTGGAKVFILGDGHITISGNITTDKQSTLVVAAKKNIFINSTVGQATNTCQPAGGGQLQGVFSAHGNITVFGSGEAGCGTANQDRMLVIDGTLIPNADNGNDPLAASGAFLNNRDLCENNLSYPAVVVSQRPDFILNMPDFAKNQNLIFSEVSP